MDYDADRLVAAARVTPGVSAVYHAGAALPLAGLQWRGVSLLSNAKLLSTAGRKEAAGKMLEKLLANYAASKHCEEARKILGELKGGGD